MPHYYDIHAHLADPRIAAELPLILRDCQARGVRGILANAARVDEWPTIVTLAREPGVYGALGLHPFFLDEWTDALPAQLRATLAAAPGLRAIGEIGLDFWPATLAEPACSRERQVTAFTAQLALACELGRPVLLHNRKSWPEFFEIWKSTAAGRIAGVCHHFTGSREIARQALDLGLYLSFCGPLTWPQSRRLRETAAYVPLDRLLTETDTPDLPAAPYRGGFSYPWQVAAIVAEIARLKSVPEDAVAAAVAENFHTVLGVAPTRTS